MVQFYCSKDVSLNFGKHLFISKVNFGQFKVYLGTQIVVYTVDLLQKLDGDVQGFCNEDFVLWTHERQTRVPDQDCALINQVRV